MNASEDFMLLILHTHVISVANMFLSLNPSASVRGIAMSIVNNYVHLPREDDVVAEKCDMAFMSMPLKYFCCVLYGTDFTMLLERVMEKECCYTGRFYWSFSSQAINETIEAANMLLQLHTFRSREGSAFTGQIYQHQRLSRDKYSM